VVKRVRREIQAQKALEGNRVYLAKLAILECKVPLVLRAVMVLQVNKDYKVPLAQRVKMASLDILVLKEKMVNRGWMELKVSREIEDYKVTLEFKVRRGQLAVVV
jgi:hypothetical protein